MKKIYNDIDLEKLYPIINKLAQDEKVRLDFDNIRDFVVQVAIMSYLQGLSDATEDILGKNFEGVEFTIKGEQDEMPD